MESQGNGNGYMLKSVRVIVTILMAFSSSQACPTIEVKLFLIHDFA